jgi:hypothetical protein
MGLHIYSTVNFDGIQAEEWERVYQESLIVIKNFPAPLMRLDRRTIDGDKRYVYTKGVVIDEGLVTEYWDICGDLTSYQRAENFSLFKDMSHYTKKISEKFIGQDVLFADPEHGKSELDYIDCLGSKIFDEKTQGYPYHLAILAIAILIESRFPKQTFTYGEFDREQVNHVIQWLNTFLANPVSLPICLDGERLLNRIAHLYEDVNYVYARFSTLYRDSLDSCLSLFSVRFGDQIIPIVAESLKGYHSPTQLGAKKIILAFLESTQNIDSVAHLVSLTQLKCIDLLEWLSKSYITIPLDERAVLLEALDEKKNLPTVDDLFQSMFSNLHGRLEYIDYYCSVEELVDAFSSYFSDDKSDFLKIVSENDHKCREQLAEITLKFKQKEQAKTDHSEFEVKNNVLSGVEPLVHESSTHFENSLEVAYLLEEIQSQKKGYKDIEAILQSFEQPFAVFYKRLEDELQFSQTKEPREFLKKINLYSAQAGFALKESAWEAIDAETDVNYLKVILALSMINNNEMNFWHLRIYILEHKELWKQVYLKIKLN